METIYIYYRGNKPNNFEWEQHQKIPWTTEDRNNIIGSCLDNNYQVMISKNDSEERIYIDTLPNGSFKQR